MLCIAAQVRKVINAIAERKYPRYIELLEVIELSYNKNGLKYLDTFDPFVCRPLLW